METEGEAVLCSKASFQTAITKHFASNDTINVTENDEQLCFTHAQEYKGHALYDSPQPTKRQRKWSFKSPLIAKRLGFGGGDSGSGGRFNKDSSYRNTGAGAGAGGRWTLHGNQRHSATGKRTPEMKQQRRDEHNWFEGEKPQLNPGCWSSLVFPCSFSLTVVYLTS